MGRISDGCGKLRKEWAALWPRREPPIGRRGYNPEDPNIKPPSTPSPAPPSPIDNRGYDPNVGQPPPVPTVGSAIPIVVMRERDEWPFETLTFMLETLVEDRIRAIVREEIKRVQEEDADG